MATAIKAADLERVKARIFDLRKKGLSYREISKITGYGYIFAKNAMIDYEPYLKWRSLAEEKRQEVEAEIVSMVKAGRRAEDIADALCVSHRQVTRVRKSFDAKQARQATSQEADAYKLRFAIFVEDVEAFRQLTKIGDELAYDETEFGMPVMCRVEAKYPHFAMTDAGCFEWSWLTIKNRKRIGK